METLKVQIGFHLLPIHGNTLTAYTMIKESFFIFNNQNYQNCW